MLVGAGNRRHGLVRATLLVAALAGCSQSADDDTGAKATASTTATAAGTAAKSGGGIGAAGSACELPVTFDIAEDWTAEAVHEPPRQGPVALVCEVDAKPAGHIGFLRVWTGAPGADDAGTVLKAFMAAETGATKARYSAFKAGALSGVEVRYTYKTEFDDTAKTERALAVTTPRGPVVVHLGGLDDGEHEAMLPAYELAKRTVKAEG
ncbi:lipoprotein [Streptomyces sp. AK08-02]|uniref:lipoprotein n=1 Tax=Streptomyces sp. AK08-02 TaxID=3028654 RepID=UPI0029BEADD5|nr:lipoprotein [Streptomyces sp. AK08-02]MDX3750935.1 lipoprotein [Streptomyces sp. AK08-02]